MDLRNEDGGVKAVGEKVLIKEQFQNSRGGGGSKSPNQRIWSKLKPRFPQRFPPKYAAMCFFQLKKKMTTQVMGGVNFARVSRPGAEKFPSSCHNGSTVHTATAILATVTF